MAEEFTEQVEDYASFLADHGLGEGETETVYLEDDDAVEQLIGEELVVIDVFRQAVSATYPDVIHIIAEYNGEKQHFMGEDTAYDDPDTGEHHRSLAMQLMTLVSTEDRDLPLAVELREKGDGDYTWQPVEE